MTILAADPPALNSPRRPDTGGPAFPRPGYYPDDPADRLETAERVALESEPQAGMTLCDWFAGHALAGYLAMHSGPDCATPEPTEAARTAYRYAAAMVAHRETLR